MLVKASIAGAIVTNTLFMSGVSLLFSLTTHREFFGSVAHGEEG
jgi:Ca2+/H+ antiporter